MASSLATMLDLEDTCGFEVAAAKKNSQVIATILQNTPKAEEVMPSAFDSTTDFDDMTDEEIEQVAKDEASQLFLDIFPNTELDIDLKLFTLKPGRISKGEILAGMLTRDGEDRYCFVQNAPKKKREVNPRNPQLYKGTCINVSQQGDGTLYPSFNRPRFTEEFTFKHFCLKASEELQLVSGLVGEEVG